MGDKPGPNPYMSSTEEWKLADILVDVAMKLDMVELENRCIPLQDHLYLTKDSWSYQLWPHMDGSEDLWKCSRNCHIKKEIQLQMLG